MQGGEDDMIESIVQFSIVAIWIALLAIHTRRLIRLARVEVISRVQQPMRHQLGRVWFWLGREEFWRSVYPDGLRCAQLTVLVFLCAIGALL
jgi:hypothetical protein